MNLKSYGEHSEFENYLNKISKECKPYINLLRSLVRVTSYTNKHQPIFLRGMRESDEFMYKKVRKSRRPLDSVYIVDNKLVDDIFFKNLGVRPRSEGLFTSTNFSTTETYGNTYIVFPIGDFDYITNNGWVDLIDAWETYWEVVEDYNMTGSQESKDIIDIYGGLENGKVPKKWIEYILKDYNKNGVDIEVACKEGQEVIFICDDYYAIKYNKENLNRILEWLK